MNRNRHIQYRRSIYRKRKIKTIIISTVVALLVLFVLFMIIGTALHAKTQKTPSEEPEYTDDIIDNRPAVTTAKTVGAYALPLLEDGSKFSDRLAGIQPNSNAVCIALNNAEGTLLFRSDLAKSLPQLSIHDDASSLTGSVGSIENEGFYISGALYVTAFSQENSLLRDVELSTWGAIACEALQNGVGDVLLVAPEMSANDVGRICAVADSIHSNVERSVVGLLLPESVLENENSAALIKELSTHFNYLTLDTSNYKEGEDAVAYIEGRVSSLQLELMYYKMRVRLPRASDSDTQKQYIDAVAKYNITSWLVLP